MWISAFSFAYKLQSTSGEQRPDRQSDKRVNDTHETTAMLIGRAERGFFQQSC